MCEAVQTLHTEHLITTALPWPPVSGNEACGGNDAASHDCEVKGPCSEEA